jgi:hypothetical protein
MFMRVYLNVAFLEAEEASGASFSTGDGEFQRLSWQMYDAQVCLRILSSMSAGIEVQVRRS